MFDIIGTNGNSPLGFIKNGALDGIGKPFSEPIFLISVLVAGTSHVKDIHTISNNLKIGDKLNLFREPNNEYDNFAILVHTKDNQKLGYVPQKDNLILARLMDGGKILYATIDDLKVSKTGWVRITIKIFLDD